MAAAQRLLNYQPEEDWQPVIVAACRTPVGRAYGSLASVPPQALLAPLFGKLLAALPAGFTAIDEVIIGNATGGGGNIARLAALAAGLPLAVPGVTVDRQCGSGLEAVINACRLVQARAGECYLAGGVESVSTAPWRVEKPATLRQMPRFYPRARFSPEEIGDPEMGIAAENVARQCAISRERQDRFALRSHQRALAAAQQGAFREEIVALNLDRCQVENDECPRPDTSLARLAALPPVFAADGSVTAGNCCPLNDGAALLLVMSRRMARDCGFSQGLLFADACSAGVDPNLLGLGPVPATQKLLRRQPGLALDRVEVIEFNEAFAAQVLASVDALGIAEHRINQQGGAIALGHPYGASGAIMVTRLFSQLVSQRQSEGFGLAMLGIAGGLGLSALFKGVRL
ncbi:thiolase family protein [Erwinia amylovora]|uniref:3-ketoacyl-CoA thiolase n=1 Tax=Erwinia amylovora ATCC BAA-2158 TaxID=889211 RepID=E5B8B2_ERWAM|nr:thiolase family protein [Erwinia amylovora]MBZ2399108.1 thiolase family protein [Erwinia amylovora]MBZ2403074.1 thiolase family protein [Erwinia amylovora]CBX81717.1 3-ketoacyl-CoA thiolase [Erwinia amylovora ATCC BAA-2158]